MTKRKTKKNALKSHEDVVKKQNEWCFLPRKQKISYDGLVFLEIFHLEDFEPLRAGLNKIYENLHPVDKDRLRYNDLIIDSPNRLFQKNHMPLPYINHIKLKGKILPSGVYFDLGDYIEHICLILHKVSPSMIVLHVHVYLNDSLSSKINDVIYTYHEEEREKIESEGGNYESIKYPEQIKEREISKIRKTIKKEAIDFLSSFFKGYFLSYFKTEIVPSIGLFSLKYPSDNKKLLEWGRKNSGFLRCLNTHLIEYQGAKYNEFVLLVENKIDSYYDNLIILGNKNLAKTNGYGTSDSAIKYHLLNCSFELFAIYRWLEVQQKTVGELNKTISKEIKNLEKSKLKELLSNRKKTSNKVFQFERFKVEFEKYWSSGNIFPFVNFHDNTKFFDNVKKSIIQTTKDIDKYISMYNKHSDVILNMTNIEFSNKIQKKIHLLTWIMIIFMIIQIIIAVCFFNF